MIYEIRQGSTPSECNFFFYGGNSDFVSYRGSEALIHGPAETGKTISALNKLHICACKYPKASIVIARKTLSSTFATVLQTFLNKVLSNGNSNIANIYGGEKPQWFDYPNGSRIWITGLDKSSKVLSAEHDIIYVNQAEELLLDDWETLTTRTTGRAGNMPYSQTIGDCNPSYPLHWMYHRPSLKLFYSNHQDNPTLYQVGELTEQGKRTMAVLESLTGTRRTRLLEGKPAQAEGIIYEEWDEAVHLIYENELPECQRHIASLDWGYVHPGVMGVWGIDGDGRMYLVCQVYKTGQTIDWWIERGKEFKVEFGIETFIGDPSQPAYIEAFRRAGLKMIAANNDVLPGIDKVKQRLKDKRLFIVRDRGRYLDTSLQEARRPFLVEHEWPGYVWADSKIKEIPIKELDDGLDSVRYAAMYLDRPKRTFIV